MNKQELSTKDMREALGDLAKPDWDEVLVEQLYRVLMDESAPPVLVELAASGFKLGKLDKTYWKPSDRNVI